MKHSWNCAKCGFSLGSDSHKCKCLQRPLSLKVLERQQREQIRKKAYRRIERSKRRELGFIPLNKPFAGSVAHHIDKTHIVYIPEKLHASISHNIWTGKGMKEINSKAQKFFS